MPLRVCGGGSNKYRLIQRECNAITLRSLWPLRPEIARARQHWEIYGAPSLHLPPGWEHGASPRRKARLVAGMVLAQASGTLMH